MFYSINDIATPFYNVPLALAFTLVWRREDVES